MNIYMFPISDGNKSASKNPYIDNLINTIENNHCIVVNKEKINKFGVLEVLLYVHKVDVYYLNWIENLPDRRFGWIQAIVFFIIFLILKLFRKKIIWMMHNKLSHSKKGLFLKILTNYLLVNYADVVLTHSREGVRFGNTLMNKGRNIEFMHHPIEIVNQHSSKNKKKNIDILIWGSISPYKGIDVFLEYLQKNNLSRKYNIHIIGKITNSQLEEKLKSFTSENIIIQNDFVSIEKLEDLFSNAKLVLFTYAGYSTLASGALMNTLKYGNIVLGPDVGSFRDLKEEGIIETFTNYDNLHKHLDNILLHNEVNNDNLVDFIERNSWIKFGNWLCNIISRKNNEYS